MIVCVVFRNAQDDLVRFHVDQPPLREGQVRAKL